jgi:hypothetical protein
VAAVSEEEEVVVEERERVEHNEGDDDDGEDERANDEEERPMRTARERSCLYTDRSTVVVFLSCIRCFLAGVVVEGWLGWLTVMNQ